MTYTCRHCGTEHHTYGAPELFYCGCDGTPHMACKQKLPPAGTPRPADWPIYLSWRTAENPPWDMREDRS